MSLINKKTRHNQTQSNYGKNIYVVCQGSLQNVQAKYDLSDTMDGKMHTINSQQTRNNCMSSAQ